MSCLTSVVVPAPIDQVWATLKTFHDMSWAAGVIVKVDVIGNVPDGQPGAKRVLNGVLHETLQSIDNSKYTYSYTLDDGPGPISKSAITEYVGVIKLEPVTMSDETVVMWTSTFEAKDPDAVAEFCNPICDALLTALCRHFDD